MLFFRHVYFCRLLGHDRRQIWQTSDPHRDVNLPLLLRISNLFRPLLRLGRFHQVSRRLLHRRYSTGRDNVLFLKLLAQPFLVKRKIDNR